MHSSTRERFKTAQQGIREEKTLRKWEQLESGRGIKSSAFDPIAQHQRQQQRRQRQREEQHQMEKYGMSLPNVAQIRSVRGAEAIRNKVIQNIAERIHLIQNAAHGETKLKELNDSINDLLKEKEKLEERILKLNGPDYRKQDEKAIPMEERDVITVDGYHYFGAAKLLPGVKELFEKKNFVYKQKETIDEYKELDAEYYGLDQNDEHLTKLETPQEAACREEMKKQLWERFEKSQRLHHVARRRKKASAEESATMKDEENSTLVPNFPIPDANDPFAVLHVDHTRLPTPQDMNQAIVEARKEQILNRYQTS